MTEEQIRFIKKYFFLKDEGCRDLENIAQELLQKGSCIVAGDNKLWHQGVGNFIEISRADNTVGCSLLTFDKKSFLQSSWLKDQAVTYIKELEHKIQALENEKYSIYHLPTY